MPSTEGDLRRRLARHHAVTLFGSVFIIAGSIGMSYALARAGEPTSAWWWCTVMAVCP